MTLREASVRARVAALLEGRTLEHHHGRLTHDHDLGYIHHAHIGRLGRVGPTSDWSPRR